MVESFTVGAIGTTGDGSSVARTPGVGPLLGGDWKVFHQGQPGLLAQHPHRHHPVTHPQRPHVHRPDDATESARRRGPTEDHRAHDEEQVPEPVALEVRAREVESRQLQQVPYVP